MIYNGAADGFGRCAGGGFGYFHLGLCMHYNVSVAVYIQNSGDFLGGQYDNINTVLS